jgi:hypothetical protein
MLYSSFVLNILKKFSRAATVQAYKIRNALQEYVLWIMKFIFDMWSEKIVFYVLEELISHNVFLFKCSKFSSIALCFLVFILPLFSKLCSFRVLNLFLGKEKDCGKRMENA